MKTEKSNSIINELFSDVSQVTNSLGKSTKINTEGEIVGFNLSSLIQDKIRENIKRWNNFINELEKEKVEKVELDEDTYYKLRKLQVGLAFIRRVMLEETGENLELLTNHPQILIYEKNYTP